MYSSNWFALVGHLEERRKKAAKSKKHPPILSLFYLSNQKNQQGGPNPHTLHRKHIIQRREGWDIMENFTPQSVVKFYVNNIQDILPPNLFFLEVTIGNILTYQVSSMPPK